MRHYRARTVPFGAIEERFYRRTARMFYVGVERSRDGDDLPKRYRHSVGELID